MQHPFKKVIIIPSYNELEALPEFLSRLIQLIPPEIAVVIADDSPYKNYLTLQGLISDIPNPNSIKIFFSHNNGKGGRGAAVKRGLAFSLFEFPSLTHLIECDADGSHQPVDIVRVIEFDETTDLVIGSRYVPGSKISNWPIARIIFSRILNFLIPRILGLGIKDVTNGLRRYSVRSARKIIEVDSLNTGFTYLSEQALIVGKSQFSIVEIPIHFINRTLGSSTVSSTEVIQSIVGIRKLLPLRK